MASIPDPPATIIDRILDVVAAVRYRGKTGWDVDAVPTTPNAQIPKDQGDAQSAPNRKKR